MRRGSAAVQAEWNAWPRPIQSQSCAGWAELSAPSDLNFSGRGRLVRDPCALCPLLHIFANILTAFSRIMLLNLISIAPRSWVVLLLIAATIIMYDPTNGSLELFAFSMVKVLERSK